MRHPRGLQPRVSVGDGSEDSGLPAIYTAGSKLAAEVPEPIMWQDILGQISALYIYTRSSNYIVQYDPNGKLACLYTTWRTSCNLII